METYKNQTIVKVHRYIRSIRNRHKRYYAMEYLICLLGKLDTLDIEYECSYLAAQAARMEIDDLLR